MKIRVLDYFRRIDLYEFVLDGRELEHVSEFKYLEFLLDNLNRIRVLDDGLLVFILTHRSRKTITWK